MVCCLVLVLILLLRTLAGQLHCTLLAVDELFAVFVSAPDY